MTSGQVFLGELKQEAAATRKMLERVPFDQASWKPHEKSMNLVGLAQHIADLVNWVYYTIKQDELDFAAFTNRPPAPRNSDELLKQFDENLKRAEEVLSNVSDEELAKPWSLRHGEQIFFTMPKGNVLRSFSFNHLVHHRGQLTVYLRLLGIPVPRTYGPTADEQ